MAINLILLFISVFIIVFIGFVYLHEIGHYLIYNNFYGGAKINEIHVGLDGGYINMNINHISKLGDKLNDWWDLKL